MGNICEKEKPPCEKCGHIHNRYSVCEELTLTRIDFYKSQQREYKCSCGHVHNPNFSFIKMGSGLCGKNWGYAIKKIILDPPFEEIKIPIFGTKPITKSVEKQKISGYESKEVTKRRPIKTTKKQYIKKNRPVVKTRYHTFSEPIYEYVYKGDKGYQYMNVGSRTKQSAEQYVDNEEYDSYEDIDEITYESYTEIEQVPIYESYYENETTMKEYIQRYETKRISRFKIKLIKLNVDCKCTKEMRKHKCNCLG